ncbi:hypothetical protein M3147_04195 [Agromyces mediolanus]|uniref:hypothetical protein n=1 Tax=Agromyces mediolanus TaxID=41986 RepID=UPI00203A67C2|nr:hypothetical protein [Agromyces mediolanus]MCM3656445.1 hypothetical protein [Agromyces mediolanus]
MTSHAELPEEIDPGVGFSVRAARGAGVGRGRLQNASLAAPVYGMRIDAATQVTRIDRCRLLLGRLEPPVYLSHRTAAEIWRLQLPVALDDPIHLSVLAPRRAPHAAGIRGHQLRLRPGDVATVDGLPVTTPVRTWLDLGAAGASVEELVIAGDRILHRRSPLAGLGDLVRRTNGWRGRGGARLRAALPLLDPGSDSSPETRVRLAMAGRGFPAPVAQFRVLDAAGGFVAVSDLAFPEYLVACEYEGDHHRSDPRQWSSDLARFNRYTAAGWAAFRLSAADLAALDEALDLVERALRARGWRGPR